MQSLKKAAQILPFSEVLDLHSPLEEAYRGDWLTVLSSLGNLVLCGPAIVSVVGLRGTRGVPR